ncbi:MAG: response regulator [Bacilli bacterium]|nr:response regulator [Bacilli bacterium]
MFGDGLFFPICALPFAFLIVVLFFNKDHINSEETRIYKWLIVLNFFGLLIEISCTFASYIYYDYTYISDFIYKLYLAYLISWTSIFTYYIYRISSHDDRDNVVKRKRYKRTLLVFIFLSIFIMSILPIDLVIKDNFRIRYTTGLSVSFTYFVSFLLVIVMLTVMIKNYKHIKNKKYIPVFVFFVVGSIAIVVQLTYPQLLLMTYVESFICSLMYFTIENPDVQMMEELYKNKKLIEKSNEDTSNFLFRMTQDIKKPIDDIINISSDMLEIKNVSELKEGSAIINSKAKELDYLVNDVLDVSLMDTKNLRTSNNRYNISNLCKEVFYQVQGELSDDVKFDYSVSNNLPNYLYGDSIRLKKIIYSALDNSVKNTNSGFINVEINSIIKYDICRLIISISDSGSGISIDAVNDILSLNIDDLSSVNISDEKDVLNLKEIKKLVMILGGNLVLRSEINKGTTVSITIDQKIVNSENDEVLKKLDLYEESLQSNKKVMVVDDDAKELSKITDYLEKHDVSVNRSLFGRDVINKISTKHKFDFILLDDETNTISAYEVLKELKKNPKFNIPVIVMIDDQKEFIKLHFLKDGFSDVLLKSKLESELERILKRF